MTDAPKIDTQAPAHICAYDDGLGAPDSRTWSDVYPIGTPYLRADLADARAAAAAQAMREAAAARIEAYDENARDNYAAFKGLPDLEKCWAGHAEAAGQMVRAVKRLPLPDTAALDRLIAERVREAVEAALDAVHEADSSELAMHGTTKIAERIEAQIAARGSKEGQS